jgi:hypothetical protein
MPKKRKQPRKNWVGPWDSDKLIQDYDRDDLRFAGKTSVGARFI